MPFLRPIRNSYVEPHILFRFNPSSKIESFFGDLPIHHVVESRIGKRVGQRLLIIFINCNFNRSSNFVSYSCDLAHAVNRIGYGSLFYAGKFLYGSPKLILMCKRPRAAIFRTRLYIQRHVFKVGVHHSPFRAESLSRHRIERIGGTRLSDKRCRVV